MTNIKIQNDMRINLSSFSKIFQLKKYLKLNQGLNNSKKYIFNNKKIININNFEFYINKKKVKFTTYYTNPFNVIYHILSGVKFEKTKNPVIKKLCDKIFISSKNNNFNKFNLNDIDLLELNTITIKKNKFIKYYDQLGLICLH